MYDIKPLELEWKKYTKKRKKPWYVGGFLFIVLIILFIFSGNIKINFIDISEYFKSMNNNSLPAIKDVKSNVILEDALETLEIINPVSIEIVEEKKPVLIEVVEEKKTESPNILVDIPILEDMNKPVNDVLSENRKKVHLEIIETSSITAYKDVEKRFLQSHDVDDALFLANSYYKKGHYSKAEHWALETNKIDETLEESLLIFAKSKAKLGHKDEAVSILSKYIDKSASKEAENVLFKIKNDTL